MKQTVATDTAPKAIGPYSQAVVHNGIAYLSGQIALDPGNWPVRRWRHRSNRF